MSNPLDEDRAPMEGWVDSDLREEFPELRLLEIEMPAPPRRSVPSVKAQLRAQSSRFHGAQALTMRRQPIPHAYRVFFRHIGLDPDTTRTPIEAVAVERLMRGGFLSRNRIDDALLVALVETGVPVWALDVAKLSGPLGIRPARVGEQVGEGELAHDLPEGRLVVADADRPLGVLFGDLDTAALPSKSTTRLRIFTIVVAGVPSIHAEEALWACANALELA